MTRTHCMGIRILGLALCLGCLLSLALPAGAVNIRNMREDLLASPLEAPALACTVRLGPYPWSMSIGYFEDGSQISVEAGAGGYYSVDCYGMRGYIAASQVKRTEKGEYYVNCREDSADTVEAPYVAWSELLLLRPSVIQLTKEQLGAPYVHAGSRPGAFDCSGLTSYIYRQYGYTLSRAPNGQLCGGLIVPWDSLQPGDILFFRWAGETELTSHVGLYVGDGQMIHAGSNGVAYANINLPYFADHFVGARRILSAAPTRLEAATALGTEAAPVYIRSVGSLSGNG